MIIAYILQVTICLACFYAFYHLLLHKETLFETNRIYLLATVLISLILPLIKIYVQAHQQEASIVAMPYVYVGSYMNEMSDAIKVTPAQKGIPWLYIIRLIYLAGTLIAGIHFINEIGTILAIRRKGQKTFVSGQLCILSDDVKSPFSFFNTIYLPTDHHFNEKELGEIISHEKAHVRNWHSIDIIFMELVCIGLWPSPMIYLYRKKLREVHEFLADAEVLKNTPWENYASFLVSQKGTGLQNHLSNQMFYSQLKNRLLMMNKKRSFQSAGLKYLGIIPILLLALVIFSFREKSGPNTGNDPMILLTVTKDKKYFLNSQEVPFDQLDQALAKTIRKNDSTVFVQVDSTATGSAIADLKPLEDKYHMVFVLKSPKQPELAKFLIVIEKKENQLQLTCKDGCGWKSLIVNSSSFNEPQAIDQYGMTLVSATQLLDDPEHPNFLFTIKGEDNGVSLTGIKGTAWTKLNFNRPKDMWIQAIDQFGMTSIDEQGQSTNVAHLLYLPKDTLPATVVTAYRFTDPPSDVNPTSEYRPDPNIYEDMAIFPGCEDVPIQQRGMCGQTNLMGYINSHLVYSESLKKAGIEGQVIISFTVGIDGYVKNTVIEKSLSPEADDAVLQVFKNMNKEAGRWLPARKEGKTVEAEMTLPVTFSLSSAEEKTIWDQPYAMVEEMPRFPGCEEITKTVKTSDISKGGFNFPPGSVKVTSGGNELIENKDYTIDNSTGHLKIINQVFLQPDTPINVSFKNDDKANCATEAMFNYIYSAIKYPQEDREKGNEGLVIAKFTVTADGSISNTRVVRGISPGLDAEIVRVINGMNDLPEKWIPGKHDGNAVPVELTLPFKFVLQPKDQVQENVKSSDQSKDSNVENTKEVKPLFSLSPNPVNENIKIEFLSEVNHASIVDGFGQMVWDKTLLQGENRIQSINVAQWIPGTYHIQATSGGKYYSSSFVVQH